MCSRHPEPGAGAAYSHFDSDKAEWWHALQTLPEIPRQPVWVARAQYGGWDSSRDSSEYLAEWQRWALSRVQIPSEGSIITETRLDTPNADGDTLDYPRSNGPSGTADPSI